MTIRAESESLFMALAAEFWKRVDVQGEEDHWLWKQSAFSGSGYGQWKLPRFLGWGIKNARAHRVAWFVTYGPIPPGWTVDHRCRVRRCCNPRHLRLRTWSANSSDNGHRSKTHCPKGHLYSGENLVVFKQRGKYPGLNRMCRACRAAESRKRGLATRRSTR